MPQEVKEEELYEMTKSISAMEHYSNSTFIGAKGDRKTWTEIDYSTRMRALVEGSFYSLAVLLTEVKEKFFAGEKRETWQMYLENTIGMKYSNVYSLILIAKRVFPLLDHEKADMLGRSKLGLVAQIKDDAKRAEFLETVTKEDTVEDVKTRMTDEGLLKGRADGGISGVKFASPRSVANKIQKVDDMLTSMLPCKDEGDEITERKKRNLEAFAADVGPSWESFKNLMDFMMTIDPKKMFVENIPAKST